MEICENVREPMSYTPDDGFFCVLTKTLSVSLIEEGIFHTEGVSE